MRALIWIVEETWRSTVGAAAKYIPSTAEVTLLHVAPIEAETVARGGWQGLLGRHYPQPDRTLQLISSESAQALLADAKTLLGRDATELARRGHIAQEVLSAAEGFDLLVCARDTDRRDHGPHSLGPATRRIVDHAPCAVLLIWPEPSSGTDKSS
jgi:nucleotide-binding universal stress UspA family protein